MKHQQSTNFINIVVSNWFAELSTNQISPQRIKNDTFGFVGLRDTGAKLVQFGTSDVEIMQAVFLSPSTDWPIYGSTNPECVASELIPPTIPHNVPGSCQLASALCNSEKHAFRQLSFWRCSFQRCLHLGICGLFLIIQYLSSSRSFQHRLYSCQRLLILIKQVAHALWNQCCLAAKTQQETLPAITPSLRIAIVFRGIHGMSATLVSMNAQ